MTHQVNDFLFIKDNEPRCRIYCKYKGRDLFIITLDDWNIDIGDKLVLHKWEYVNQRHHDIDLYNNNSSYTIKIIGVDIL